jgi:hypothetical protein
MRLAHSDRGRFDLPCQSQNSDIGAGIASGDLCRQDAAASRHKLKIIFSRQRLFGGDDDLGSPHHAGHMPPVGKADSDNRVFRSFRTCGQRVRELGQEVCLIGHGSFLSV